VAIFFHKHETSLALKNRRLLKSFLLKEIKTLRPNWQKIQLNFIFCNDEYLLLINQQFLNHNTYTDIITFDLSPSEKILNAEIYISLPRVKDNASQLSISFSEELHRVIFHGCLHLCGFKDKSKNDKLMMRKMENLWLKKYKSITG